jgi:hypothetical protein
MKNGFVKLNESALECGLVSLSVLKGVLGNTPHRSPSKNLCYRSCPKQTCENQKCRENPRPLNNEIVIYDN